MLKLLKIVKRFWNIFLWETALHKELEFHDAVSCTNTDITLCENCYGSCQVYDMTIVPYCSRYNFLIELQL